MKKQKLIAIIVTLVGIALFAAGLNVKAPGFGPLLVGGLGFTVLGIFGLFYKFRGVEDDDHW